jgi:ureidoacrylate peracid hydrolase
MAAGALTSAAAASRSRVITIDAKPEPVEIDTARTTVLVVDMQNDFASKGGIVHGLGFRYIRNRTGNSSDGRGPGLRARCRNQDHIPEDGFPGRPLRPGQPRFSQSPGTSPRRRRKECVRAKRGRSRILIRDTWNKDIVDELKPHNEDLVLYKARYSGLYQTALDATLKRDRVKNLIVVGCTTSVCVESTVRDAMFRDIAVFFSVTAWPKSSEPIFRGASTKHLSCSWK